MDEIHFAPPKKPNGMIRCPNVRTNKPCGFNHGFISRCETGFATIHTYAPRVVCRNPPSQTSKKKKNGRLALKSLASHFCSWASRPSRCLSACTGLGVQLITPGRLSVPSPRASKLPNGPFFGRRGSIYRRQLGELPCLGECHPLLGTRSVNGSMDQHLLLSDSWWFHFDPYPDL